MGQMVRTALACLLVLMLSTVAAFAQQTVAFASVAGRVIDTTGTPVPGASVTVRQLDTNALTTVVTDSAGRFRFGHLRPGGYELRVELSGFAAVKKTLTLLIGGAVELPVTLTVSGGDTQITVNGRSEVLDTARTQIAATITPAEIRDVPVNGRNFLDLALLAPGVSPANNGPTQQFSETSAAPGAGLSVSSQRNFSNNFVVDGLSANDDAAGLSGMPYGIDALEQFQVVTSGGQAELGRALGGYVSALTRSGTNTFHGDAYGFFRDRRLNANNLLTGTRLPFSQQQIGGSVGGPVRHDRTFFFGNIEDKRQRQTGVITISDASVSAINARLAAVGYRGPGLTTGEYANPVDSMTALAKVDQVLRGGDQLMIRYSAYRVAASNSRNAGGLNAVSASAALHNVDQALALNHTWTINSSLVNELRTQVTHSDLTAPPTDPVGPAVNIAGVAVFGTLSGSPTSRTNSMFQVVDNVSKQLSRHALRAGADFLLNGDTIEFPRSNRGAYTFASLNAFLAGTYNNAGFTQTFGPSAVSQTNPNLGVYVQDEWHAHPRLTVDLGLRYDLQWLRTIALDTNNISPRAGLAWAPGASQRTVVRLNAGRFYDRVPLRALANALLSANNTSDLTQLQQINVSLSPGQTGAPVFPNILSGVVPATTLVNFTTIDPHLQNAYSDQASVEIERKVGASAVVSVGYDYLRGRDLIAQVNQNVPACTASGSNNGCRPVSTYANNSQYSAVGSSTYHGLHISLRHRPAKWGSYRISYALSKAMNNVGENFFNSPIDPFDINKDWGRSDDDQRHRLTVNGTLSARGFQLSGVAQYYSSLPLNITSGVTTIQGTAGRPVVNGAFITRNSGTLGDFFTTSLKLTRPVNLGRRGVADLAIEVFNASNRRNVLARNANFGAGGYPAAPSSSFNSVTAVGDPRAAQLSVRIRF
jgi:hypothetical protein